MSTKQKLTKKPNITFNAWKRHARIIGITLEQYSLNRANGWRYCQNHRKWMKNNQFYDCDQRLCKKCRYLKEKCGKQKVL